MCAIRALKAPGALRADRAPRGFQLHEEVPSPWCSETGDPLLELLELRFVSLSSETSRSFGTTQTSQSSIGSHPAFPDAPVVLQHQLQHLPSSGVSCDGTSVVCVHQVVTELRV